MRYSSVLLQGFGLALSFQICKRVHINAQYIRFVSAQLFEYLGTNQLQTAQTDVTCMLVIGSAE